jgi:hypothetical protein
MMVGLFVLVAPFAAAFNRSGDDAVHVGGLPGAVAVVDLGGASAPSEEAATTAPDPFVTPTVVPTVIPPSPSTTAPEPVMDTVSELGAASVDPPRLATRAISESAQPAAGQAPATTAVQAPLRTTPPPTSRPRPKPTSPPTTQAPRPAPPAPTSPPATAAPTTAAPATTAVPATTAPAPPSIRYSQADNEAVIRAVWPDDLEDRAVEIARRESNLHNDVRNYCCYGLFQIYWNVHRGWLAGLGVTSAEQLYDPVVNATAAFALYQRSGGWGPWSL